MSFVFVVSIIAVFFVAHNFDGKEAQIHGQPLPNLFHRTDEINEMIFKLQETCERELSIQILSESPYILFVNLPPKTTPAVKSFQVFGIHPRELISTEFGIHYLEHLCGQSRFTTTEKSEDLLDIEFGLVINANPDSRILVENGARCRRTNPNFVDIERNWDAYWSPVSPANPQK